MKLYSLKKKKGCKIINSPHYISFFFNFKLFCDDFSFFGKEYFNVNILLFLSFA